MKRKALALLLALVMVLSLLPAAFMPKTAVAETGPIDQAIVQGGAILHCFDWSFDEIREALPDIAAAGYAAADLAGTAAEGLQRLVERHERKLVDALSAAGLLRRGRERLLARFQGGPYCAVPRGGE